MTELEKRRKLIENLEVELDGFFATMEDPTDPILVPEIYRASRYKILARDLKRLAEKLEDNVDAIYEAFRQRMRVFEDYNVAKDPFAYQTWKTWNNLTLKQRAKYEHFGQFYQTQKSDAEDFVETY